MKWTKSKPTGPGWYWHKYNRSAQIYYIDYSRDPDTQGELCIISDDVGDCPIRFQAGEFSDTSVEMPED